MTDAAPGAQPWVPDDRSLDSLRLAVQACRGCDLYRDATQAVMGAGAADARLVLLGEQPGDQEDRAGEPFVGPSGRLLERALTQAALDRAAVYATNAVKHFRFSVKGKRRIHQSPSRWHVAACGPWLVAELEQLTPSVVALLGATAGQAIYGASFRVGPVRGSLRPWPVDRIPLPHPPTVVATVHPSAVLRSRRQDEDFEAFVADLRVARDALARG